MLHTGCTMGSYAAYGHAMARRCTQHCGSEDPDFWWFDRDSRDYKVDYPPKIKFLWVCLKDSKRMVPRQKWWLNTPLSYSNGHKLGIYPHIDLCTWGASVLLPALGSGPQVLLTETINMDQDWNVCIYLAMNRVQMVWMIFFFCVSV